MPLFFFFEQRTENFRAAVFFSVKNGGFSKHFRIALDLLIL